MDLQVIDRQLKELEQSLTSIAGRVDQLRDENKSNQAELDRLTEQDKEIAAEGGELKRHSGNTPQAPEKVAENVEAGLLSRYQMIVSRRAGVAVAKATGGNCQGCRMRLPPQLYNESQKHLQIHFCQN